MALVEKYADFDLSTGANDGSSAANAWQSWSDIVWNYGERVNIKRGASRQTIGSGNNISDTEEEGGLIHLRGYKTAIGDGADSVDNWWQFDGEVNVKSDCVICEHLDGTNNTAWQNVLVGGSGGNGHIFLNCKAEQLAATSYAPLYIYNQGAAINCWAKTASTRTGIDGCTIYCGKGIVMGCHAIGNNSASGAIRVQCGYGANTVVGNVVEGGGTSGSGIRLIGLATPGNHLTVSRNRIYNCDDGIYFELLPDSSDGSPCVVDHNVIYKCAGEGIRNNDGNTNYSYLVGNAIGDATGGEISGFDNYEHLHGISLTADPFEDAAGGDFSINDTAGGGAAVRDVAGDWGGGEHWFRAMVSEAWGGGGASPVARVALSG